MQTFYWKKMAAFKYELVYLSLCFERSIKVKRGIKIACAVCSSAAIAAWASCAKLALLWGAIVVLSQVFSAAVEVFPLEERISALSSLLGRLSVLYVNIEHDWYGVNYGKYTEGEINDLIYEYERQWTIIDNKYFNSDALRKNKKFQAVAEAEVENYYQVLFGGDDENEAEKE